MKFILLFSISIYQKIISPTLKNILGVKSFCRFSPSCSSYAIEAIINYGVIKGSYLAILRVINCQPFSFQKKKLTTYGKHI